MTKALLTIGQLAERCRVKPTALRFYERQGLLEPANRSEAGYRLYTPESEQRIRFILRAQRLGFSLADIRLLLDNNTLAQDIINIAENRFLAIERQLTEFLVQKHEMELFLRDIQPSIRDQSLYKSMTERICRVPTPARSAESTLEWLMERTGCALSSPEAQDILNALRGRHVHVWQSESDYQILVIGHDPYIQAGLERLIQLEQPCNVHPSVQYARHAEGFLISVAGENAFIYAQLFLALEQNPS